MYRKKMINKKFSLIQKGIYKSKSTFPSINNDIEFIKKKLYWLQIKDPESVYIQMSLIYSKKCLYLLTVKVI